MPSSGSRRIRRRTNAVFAALLMHLRHAAIIATASAVSEREKGALLSWKLSLAGFDLSSKLETWEATKDPCMTWQGIQCQDGVVTSMSLDNQGISGSLPPQWSVLTGIRSISLKLNHLKGEPIPNAWSSLHNLEVINIADNHLHGSLPRELSTFPRLEYLQLMNNNITGSLSESIGGLKYIFIQNNRISGTLPAWNNAPIVSLKLSDNEIRGPVPATWGTWDKLQYLEMGGNSLEGLLETAAVGMLVGLSLLSLSGNYLDSGQLATLLESQPQDSVWSILPQKLAVFGAKDVALGVDKSERFFNLQTVPGSPYVVQQENPSGWAALAWVFGTAGGVVVLGMACALCFFCRQSKKQRREVAETQHSPPSDLQPHRAQPTPSPAGAMPAADLTNIRVAPNPALRQGTTPQKLKQEQYMAAVSCTVMRMSAELAGSACSVIAASSATCQQPSMRQFMLPTIKPRPALAIRCSTTETGTSEKQPCNPLQTRHGHRCPASSASDLVCPGLASSSLSLRDDKPDKACDGTWPPEDNRSCQSTASHDCTLAIRRRDLVHQPVAKRVAVTSEGPSVFVSRRRPNGVGALQLSLPLPPEAHHSAQRPAQDVLGQACVSQCTRTQRISASENVGVGAQDAIPPT